MGSAQYPEERSFDWNNVAVARRKALRGSGLLAIQLARTASSPLKCALRRATSPHVLEGRHAHTSDAKAPRERELMISAIAWLFDRLIEK
jgi:hypothetical protein